MFGFLKKDPTKALRKEYTRLLSEAMARQRSGDIKGYAAKTAEAEAVMDRIEALEREANK